MDRVDLTATAGEIHGLLGENGAGKSTLMNVLAGVIRPAAGTVTVEGHPLRLASPDDSARLGIGMVHQHFSQIPALTVAENLSLALGRGPGWFRRRADLARPAMALAERLGWRFEAETPVWQLPIGHQQRLEILKVLQRDARWLLFDEPTAVLSPPETEELFRVLAQLRSEGRGILFITHKLTEVLSLCDRITVLRHGRRIGEWTHGVTAEELARAMVGERGVEKPGVEVLERWGVEGGTISVATVPDPPLSARTSTVPQHPNTPTPQHLNTSTPALVVRNLRVRGDRGTEAVRGLSFEVRAGEIFGVGGVDGNGQAELAEAIMGLRPVRAGEVTLAPGSERETRHPKPPRPGYIPQDRRRAGLILPMSVQENLALEIYEAPKFRCGPLLRLSRLWAAARAMARQFDVRVSAASPNSGWEQPAATLSGGNQQKIVVARALTGDRALLVSVNPTRGLDIGATGYVHAQLRAARDAGVGVLLISTELDELISLSDRVAILFSGRFQGIVSPAEPRERIGQMMGGLVDAGA